MTLATQKFTFSSFILFLICLAVSGQVTRISGVVYDDETNEPIPFANIFIKGTSVGAVADDSGHYELVSRSKRDSLTATFLGYLPNTVKIIRKTTQVVDFRLYKNITNLEEIVVVPGANPAHRIFKNIQKYKDFNTLKRHSLQCNVYSKTQIKLSNIDQKFKDRKVMRPFQFVFENVDTNALTGKSYLPILISETVSDYTHILDPESYKETVKATQISGINNESVREFVGGFNKSFDIYENFMVFYTESGFVSPISNVGLLFYNYYLTDSSFRQNHWCYHITFKPRRKQERTFTGDFWVADTSFAIQSLNMRINQEANLNFITDLVAEYTFSPVNDSVWLPEKEHIVVDLNLVEWENMKGLQGDKTTIYSNYNFNVKKLEDKNVLNEILHDSLGNKQFWDHNRPVSLTEKERKVYEMVDSIKNVPAFRTAYDVLSTIFDAYYNMGKVKVGPYFSIYSYNKVEGHRFRIGGTTTAKLFGNIKLTSYLAYGTLDKEMKYYANAIWILKQTPRLSLTSLYRHDVGQINQVAGIPSNDNILSSIFRRNPFTKLQMINNFNTSFDYDISKSTTFSFLINYNKIFPGPYIPILTVADNKSIPYVTSGELGIGLHLEVNRQFFKSKFKRLKLRNENPSFDILVSKGIKGLLNGQYNFWKYKIGVKHFLRTNPFGFNRIRIEAGKTLGKVTWPLLDIMSGNETYGLSNGSFNMMNYYEFAADEYLLLSSEQHFQGIILNYIPLLRKLKLREVASVNAVTGRLHNNNLDNVTLPVFMYRLNRPYVEASLGIENIFKVLRIDALWRFTHTRHPNIEILGIRARLQFML